LAIAINKVAARYIYQTKAVLLVPVVQIFVSGLWMLWWISTALFVLSSIDNGGIVPSPESGPFSYTDAAGTYLTAGKCTATYPAGSVFYDEGAAYTYTDALFKIRAAVADPKCKYEPGVDPVCYRCTLPRLTFATAQFAYIFFSYLWNNAFIIAVGQTTIAASAAMWYFTSNEKKGEEDTVKPALKLVFRYHTGSLAFGAFILAVVQFIKWVLHYIQKQSEAQKNYVMAKIAMILKCCVQCFERFIKFLNKNAYIQIAILGKNFCRSAWAAFCLILRNFGRIGMLVTVSHGMLYVGLAFICGFTTIIGYFIVVALYPEITSPIICVFLFFIIGYMVAKLFMTVFQLAVDTTLQCFVADEELNNKSGEGSGNNYTPQELKAFLKDPAKPKKFGCC